MTELDTGQLARRVGLAVAAAFAAGMIVFHCVATGRYGYFRDEFYYLDCARHLDWGYVDHPPLAMLVLAVFRALFGDSMLAIRLPAILIGAATIFVAGTIVRSMGGTRWAQAVVCLALLVAPVYMVTASYFSMNPFDQFFWTLGAYVLVRIINADNPRLWLWFGVVAGLGLQNKLSMLFFGGALAVALLFTPQRKAYLNKYIYLGGLIAFVVFLPHIVWQATHGWPTLEFMKNASGGKNIAMAPFDFLKEQVLHMNPISVPLALAGLAFGLFTAKGRTYLVLPLMFLIVLIFFIITGAKPYYLAPAFPLVLTLGAVAVEKVHGRGWRRFAVPAYATLMALGGLIVAPLAVPLLPPEQFLQYQARLGIRPAAQEHGHTGEMPQHFGDRFGWPEMAALVVDAYDALPGDAQAECEIVAENYGEAGAIRLFGESHGLPQPICGHNNHYFWMPETIRGETVLVIGFPEEALQECFESVEELGRTNHPYAMPYENDRVLYLCRGLTVPWETLREELREFI